MSPGWYLRRLSRMSPREVADRTVHAVRKRRWRTDARQPSWRPERRFTATLPDAAVQAIPDDARQRLLATADRLMDGHAEYFGVARHDLADPDWSLDPKTGRRAPTDAYAFGIGYRDENSVGDIKQLWEPSRHQHLTVLATAFALTGVHRYANRVADHLKSWWAANPPLRGVHWVSGIELGIRLLSWVWVRRLLAGWPGAAGLFEDNPEALLQIWHHQRWLAAFGSTGSSANNHVIAEAAGQLAAACAFDFYPESAGWRDTALSTLDDQLRANTFSSGLNSELATEYHGLVLELGLASALEAAAGGVAVPRSTWLVLLRMTDALAAIVDTALRPPRQGDADDGHGLVLDGTGTDRVSSLLATGDALFGRLPWWPSPSTGDVRTHLLAALASVPSLEPVTRPEHRPSHFADAGLTIMRSGAIWCRCDGGPHGFLSIAAHAHADALSLEVRHDGVDILADPGTYCYHGEPQWREYFRGTLGHNTLRLDRRDQSTSGGPFLWTRHARSRVLVAHTPEHGIARWCGEHDGYSPAVHRRTVLLDDRQLTVQDEILGDGPQHCELPLHLGPLVDADLDGTTARLAWSHDGVRRTAVLELPPELWWVAHRGDVDPPLGWYSAGFGRREPATTLLGTGRTGATLSTVLRFTD